MSIKIQPVSRDQFAAWRRLRQSVYTGVDERFHSQEMELIFADDTKACYLSIADRREACGMIEVSLRNVVDGCLSSPVGYVEGIYVDRSYRGNGLSRQLLEQAEHWCRSRGCTEMGTDAELDNPGAQRFHQHMGFTETYRIVEYRKEL